MVPRYHTNMVGWVESLELQNVDVKILAWRREFSENHSHLKPLILQANSSKILNLLPLSKNIKSKLIAPKLSEIFREVKKINADRIVVRFELDIVSIKYLLVARLESAPVSVYTQWPVIKTPIFKRMLVALFLYLFRMRTFSPVYDKNHSKLDFDAVENSTRDQFDLEMETKLTEHHLIHWIPFTLPESLIANKNREDKKKDKPPFQFVTIGKFVERKNHLMIAEVFSKNQLFMESDSELIIIGECTTLEHRVVLQKLEQLLKNYGSGNKIKVVKNLNHGEVQKILEHSQVFLLQSTNEPASISILEAMGKSNLLILNPRSGTASYSGDNYASFASSTQHELSQCIEKVLKDKVLVERMQVRSEGIFRDYFSNRIVGLQFYDFLFRDKVKDS